MNAANAKAACALTPHPPQSKTWRLALLLGFIILHSAFGLRAWGQSYSIDWYKVGGGGGTSTGATYQVSSTIGQPDASRTMSGGSYSLTGGFWAPYAVQTPGAPYLWVMRTTTNTVYVWWAVCDPAWTLQTCSSLVTAGSTWTTCPYQTNGPNCYRLEAPPAGRKFYRLKQP